MLDGALSGQDIRHAVDAKGGLWFDAGCLPDADMRLLEPSAWPLAQAVEGRGGRGALWLVQGAFGEGMLRHYRRGGVIGRWVADRYLYLGAGRVRSVCEFRLMAELYRRGLPVPRPILAGWRRSGPFYRAELLTLRVAQARTLAEQLDAALPLWSRIGVTLARFHRQGVFHADLNAHNVLVDAVGKVWLIDFDRGALRRPEPAWQQANLARLQRSLDKLGGVPALAWQALLQGYHDTLAQRGADHG